jgi:sister chromatid cohesion protein DCC1
MYVCFKHQPNPFFLKTTDELRPIAPSYLDTLLELVLNLLVSLSMQHTSASVEALSTALAESHEVSRAVSTQIMAWFGEIQDGKWKMDVNAIVREVGLGVLKHHRVLFFTSHTV